MLEKKRVLGRGLEALIGQARQDTGSAATEGAGTESKRLFECALDNIRSNSGQPRRNFDEEGLKDLAASLREKGVIEPLIVRKAPSSGQGRFEIIAGERRWRAARIAGLKRVPVVIMEATDEESLELAIIENIQREDLNAMEEAEAYRRLMDFGLSQEAVAQRVGKGRATVANYLRLLGLPDEAKKALRNGAVTMGHARAILSLTSTAARLKLLREIIAKGLSVRYAEALASRGAGDDVRKIKTAPAADPAISVLEDELRRIFSTKTHVKDKKGRGSIEILYFSPAERERIIELLRSIGR